MTIKQAINYLKSSGMTQEQIKAVYNAFRYGTTHATDNKILRCENEKK